MTHWAVHCRPLHLEITGINVGWCLLALFRLAVEWKLAFLLVRLNETAFLLVVVEPRRIFSATSKKRVRYVLHPTHS